MNLKSLNVAHLRGGSGSVNSSRIVRRVYVNIYYMGGGGGGGAKMR